MKYSKELEAAREAVKAAALLCRRIQSELVADSTIYKGDKSPVTVADYSSQAIICRKISELFPDDPIVGEEEADTLTNSENKELLVSLTSYVRSLHPGVGSEEVCRWINLGNGIPGGRFWTLDPIDGTKGFLRGDQYAVALALIEDGTITVGTLACPNLAVDPSNEESGRGVIFTAVRGEGAFMATLDGGAETRLAVSGASDASETRMVESFESGHANHDGQLAVAGMLGIGLESVRMDSQAKYGAVARGEAELYLRIPSPKTPDYREKIWDHAAGVVVVEEAGGKVTDIKGGPLDFTRGRRLEDNRGVVVSNGRFHEGIISAIAASS